MLDVVKKPRMYEGVKTWNPYIGCRFNCIYCKPSFQRQAKRRRKWCELCYRYEPHTHFDRFTKVPNTKIIFACAYGDVYFAAWDTVEMLIETIEKHNDKTFYIQSKNPNCFLEWERRFKIPDNLILGATIESNRIAYNTPSKYGHYTEISHALCPDDRLTVMKWLKHKRKYITIEPILDFDILCFAFEIRHIKPEFVYIGYDNHNCKLPEPPLEKTLKLIEELEKFTEVRLKTIRPAWWEVSQNGSV